MFAAFGSKKTRIKQFKHIFGLLNPYYTIIQTRSFLKFRNNLLEVTFSSKLYEMKCQINFLFKWWYKQNINCFCVHSDIDLVLIKQTDHILEIKKSKLFRLMKRIEATAKQT
jgi:hypothetical protein